MPTPMLKVFSISVRSIIDQAVLAVQSVFLFTLLMITRVPSGLQAKA